MKQWLGFQPPSHSRQDRLFIPCRVFLSLTALVWGSDRRKPCFLLLPEPSSFLCQLVQLIGEGQNSASRLPLRLRSVSDFHVATVFFALAAFHRTLWPPGKNPYATFGTTDESTANETFDDAMVSPPEPPRHQRKPKADQRYPRLTKFRYQPGRVSDREHAPQIVTGTPYRYANPFVVSPGMFLDMSNDLRSERLDRWELPQLKRHRTWPTGCNFRWANRLADRSLYRSKSSGRCVQISLSLLLEAEEIGRIPAH